MTDAQTTTLGESLLTSLPWRCIGPHRGGRVVAVAGDVPTGRPSTSAPAPAASGRRPTAASTWRNVSDGFFKTAAVGALAVAESDPNVIYAGTGEASSAATSRTATASTARPTAAQTWSNVGLRDTRHIGKIRDPSARTRTSSTSRRSATPGARTRSAASSARTDGGETLGAGALHERRRRRRTTSRMDPNNPRILYAAIWQAQRYPHALISRRRGVRHLAVDRRRRHLDGDHPQARPADGAARARSASRSRRRSRAASGRWSRPRTARSSAPTTAARPGTRLSEQPLPAHPALVLHAHLRRPAGRGHRLGPELQLLEVDRRRQDLRADARRRTATTTTSGSTRTTRSG